MPLHKNFVWNTKVCFCHIKRSAFYILRLSSWHSKRRLLFRDLKLTDQISCLNNSIHRKIIPLLHMTNLQIISHYEAKQSIGGGDGQQKSIIIWMKWKYNNSFELKEQFLVEHICLKKVFLHSWGTCTKGTSGREATLTSGLRSQRDML